MSFSWLKPYMPRSLYGRALLILLLPVVTVMLVVSVVFIQRHFEGVTVQLTNAVSRELRLMLDSGMSAEDLAASEMARTLKISVLAVPEAAVPTRDSWAWDDLTGATVVRELRRRLPGLRVAELTEDKRVKLYFDRPAEVVRMTFGRWRVSASNPHQLLVNMLFFAVIMTVISILYLRNQLRPITRLARAAEAFGRGRHIDYQPAGAVEVRAAGDAFLDMRARIERHIEQRTLILSGVSHDLRTPLTRLRLALSMLDEDERKPMERDVDDMERLIDEFLAFARGAQEGESEPADPIVLLRQIVEDGQRAGVPVTMHECEGQGSVSLRPVGIRRAVENLVGNAIRYGSRAEVSVFLTDRTLCIRVEDDGPGIPESDREQALKPFARLDAARNQNLGTGVGLGLSIALDIARAHGGSLRLGESTRLGGLRAEIVIGR